MEENVLEERSEPLDKKQGVPSQASKPRKLRDPATFTNDEKRAIEAVVRFQHGWDNTNYNVNWSQAVGLGKVYAVSFTGEDENYYENYVYMIGSADPAVCKDVRDLVKSLRFGIFSSGDPNTTMRNLALAVICVILVLGITIIAVTSSNPPLEPLIAFAGLAIGYLAGKAA